MQFGFGHYIVWYVVINV